jgi:ribosomal protein S18 acetylase RimI-like enzyme
MGSKNGEHPQITEEQIRVERIADHHSNILQQLEIDESNPDEKELKAFLAEDALKQEKMEISATYLWFHNPTNKVIGYITLLTDAIKIQGTSLRERFTDQGVNYKTLPAIKIGRLCVSNEFRRMGIGKKMVVFSMRKLLEISEDVGCRFIVVDAKRGAIHFYKKLEFDILKEREKGIIYMYYDMYKIIRYFKETLKVNLLDLDKKEKKEETK